MRVLTALLAIVAVNAAFGQPVHQKTFASADDAVHALVTAVRSHDATAVLEVLGPEAEPAMHSGDPVQDENARERFLRAYDHEHSLAGSVQGAMILQVGADYWPFPFPLVRSNGRWSFDSAAGAEELVNRRVGANELSAIQACLAFVDAEREYYARNPQNDSLLNYAQKLVSTDGQKDGLYWPTNDDESPSPLGEHFARARSEGYFKKESPKGEPFHGYIYRLLTAQGPHAAGGAYNYVVRSKMIGGFALIAFPAEYGSSGVKTFIVNHDGVVYSKDLGPDTAQQARSVKSFDPGPGWTREAATR